MVANNTFSTPEPQDQPRMRSREVSQLYRHKLVLVRPDQHVAWRGDAEPTDALDLVDLVRGAARTSMAKSA
jgi:hypothetical protein